MSNHVHLIIDSCKDQLFKLLKSIKNYSGRLANQQLDRTGKKFWQKESYDNLIRDDKAMKIKINYILNNPLKARLVENWTDWPHNYLNTEFMGYLDQGVSLE